MPGYLLALKHLDGQTRQTRWHVPLRSTTVDFPHEHARSRTYRWGEDGIAGVCDSHGFQNIAFSFWNEKDKFLKERLFGLSNPQGNHGESIKEAHFHVDNTPVSFPPFFSPELL